MEVPRLKKTLQSRQAQEKEHSDLTGRPGFQQLTQDIPRELTGGMFFSAWPSGARRERRSAFSKPSGRPGSTSVFQAGRHADALGELIGLIKVVDIPFWDRLSNDRLLVDDFCILLMLPYAAPLCNAFLGALMLWRKHTMAQIPTSLSSSSTASWAFRPPMSTSLGLPTQN